VLKIWPCSDLHFRNLQDVDDFMEKVPRYADVIVVAGDVANGSKDVVRFMRHWLQAESMRQRHFIMVLGNHDYWRDIDMAMSFYAVSKLEDEFPFFHLLHRRNPVTIEDVTFIGDTLWTDMDNHNPIIESAIQRGMNDYRMVEYIDDDFARFLTPSDVFKEHSIHRDFIIQECKSSPNQDKLVVFSHHGPVGRKFIGPMDFAYYCTDIEGLLQYSEITPKVWIHGHSHARTEYNVGQTKILMNCRGYADYEKKFASEFIIEVFDV